MKMQVKQVDLSIVSTLFGDLIPPMMGGVSKYRSTRYHVVPRDTGWPATKRLHNAEQVVSTDAASTQYSPAHAQYLLNQACNLVERNAAKDKLYKTLRANISAQISEIFSAEATKTLRQTLTGGEK